jgi:hypothetical protein
MIMIHVLDLNTDTHITGTHNVEIITLSVIVIQSWVKTVVQEFEIIQELTHPAFVVESSGRKGNR